VHQRYLRFLLIDQLEKGLVFLAWMLLDIPVAVLDLLVAWHFLVFLIRLAHTLEAGLITGQTRDYPRLCCRVDRVL
jgi:hypothetical protein